MKSAFSLKLPPEMYIIGSAPSAVDAAKLIPADAYVIALNAGATVDGLTPSYHMASDWNTVNCKYWASGKLRERQKECGFAGIYSTDLLEYLECQPPDTWPDGTIYYYNRGEPMHRGEVAPKGDCLRPNGTILGEALQLCYHRGTKRALVGGVDMRGNDYHDGTTGRHLAGKTWHYVALLNEMITGLRKRGMEIYTLTETALDLPYAR